MNAWTRAALGSLGVLAVAGTIHCATFATAVGKFDPATQAKLDKCDAYLKMDVTPKEELALGGTLAVAMVAHNNGVLFAGPVSEDDPYNRYVAEVGKNLASYSSRPELPWTFAVINSPNENAFSTPGGYVFVTKGLLQKLPNEAALAGVLGHEIAHVTLRHTIGHYKTVKQQTCKSAVGQALGTGVTNFVVGSIADSLSSALGQQNGFIDLDDKLNFKALFSMVGDLEKDLASSGLAQDEEFAADKVGLQLAIDAGYNPAPYIAFVRTLAPGGGSFAHHPPSDERGDALEKWPSWLTEQGALLTAADVKAYPTVAFDQRVSSLSAP